MTIPTVQCEECESQWSPADFRCCPSCESEYARDGGERVAALKAENAALNNVVSEGANHIIRLMQENEALRAERDEFFSERSEQIVEIMRELIPLRAERDKLKAGIDNLQRLANSKAFHAEIRGVVAVEAQRKLDELRETVKVFLHKLGRGEDYVSSERAVRALLD